MNIKDFLSPKKPVSTAILFKSEEASVNAIQILQGEELTKHDTKVPAFLICVSGEVVFETEKGEKETLFCGDYVRITPLINHWVVASKDSRLILFK